MKSADETEVMLEDAARVFLANEYSLDRLRSIYHGEAALSRDLWKQFAEQGWLTLRVPEQMGGSGLQTRHGGAIARKLGEHAVAEPYVACAIMPSVIASLLNESSVNAQARNRVIDALTTGDSVFAVAWQEDPHSLSTCTSATTVTRSEDVYILTGTKSLVVAAHWADDLLVTATMNNTPSIWIVPADAPGVQVDDRVTSDGSSVSTVTFDNVRLGQQDLISQGDDVQAVLDKAIQEAVLLTSTQLTGLAHQALNLTVEYLKTRVQFGKPIGSFQSMQHHAVDVRIELALAGSAYLRALSQFEAHVSGSELEIAISAAKARASDAALKAGKFGVQAHGAIGFAAEADIGIFLKSALRLAAYLGNASFHRQCVGELVARSEETV